MEKQGQYPEEPQYPQAPPPQYQAQYGPQSAAPVQQGGYNQYPKADAVIVNPPQPFMGAPGQVQVVTVAQPYVNDYLPYSIFVCLCCCWCIGIFAIVKSCRVREERDKGNIEAAREFSKQALKLAHIALGVGIVFSILYVVLVIVNNLVLASHYN